ncbi:MAG: Nuclease SbcCD, gamma subunit [Pseudomonadota bacterium]
MKILALRGRHLASLAGEFELDFQKPPLADTGLFAICGPTGAGKSTLLDALCLALYDNTPRLKAADGRGIELPDVGSETTLPNDRRNILRRGASEGYAEVDFLGNDGERYRARWSVRRSRNKAGGKLQPAEMSLLRLPDGQPVGSHLKTEVLQAISARIGLNFEQFTRAVLLAQNEFFTFLKAGEDERAALLQTLTGTERFEQYSRRAYVRHKTEQEQLQQLRQRLAEQPPLDAAARSALEQQCQQDQVARAAADAELAARVQQKDWLQRRQQLATQLAAAEQTRQQAEQAQQDAAPRRAALARHEAVRPARPLLAACTRLAAEARLNAEQRAQLTQELEVATQRSAAACQQQQHTRSALAAAEAALQELAPRLASARRLEESLRALQNNRQQVQAQAAASAQELAAAEKAQGDEQAAQHGARTQQAQLAAEHAAQAGLAPLSQGWLRWETLLHSASTEAEASRKLAERLASNQRQITKQQAAQQQAEQAHTREFAALASADAQVIAAEAACRHHDPAALARQRESREQRTALLQRARPLWQHHQQHQASLTRLQQQQQAGQQQQLQLDGQIATATLALPPLLAAAAQAEKAWQAARQANDDAVKTWRAGLETGSPCPVCGSTDHPYAGEESGLRQLLQQLAAQLAHARDAARQQQGQLERQQGEASALARQLENLGRELATQQAELSRSHAAWDAARIDLARSLDHCPAADAAAPDWEAWFNAQHEGLEGERQQHSAAEQAWQQASAQLEQARQQREQGRQRENLARQSQEQQRQRSQELQQHQAAQAEQQQQCGERLAQHLNELDAASLGADWRPRWQADPAAFFATCRQQVSAYQAREIQLAQGQRDIEQRAIRLEAQQSSLETLRRRARSEGDSLSQLGEAIQVQTQARAAVFADFSSAVLGPLPDNGDCDALQGGLDARLQALRQQQDTATTTLAAAEKALVEQQSRQTERQRQADRLASEQATAAQQLQDWLARQAAAGLALDQEQLTQLLAVEESGLQRESQALQQLEQQLAAATGACRPLREQSQTLLAHCPAGLDPHAEAQAQAAVVEQAVTAAHALCAERAQQQQERELALRRDDDCRRRAADLLDSLAAQEKRASLWAKMNELIGAADGKKFRNYAQQLSLDILLAYANTHLRDLARRYRLQRVPGSLALMVVDRDMGEEQRSVHSLSGGEAFLVSLALALGLAALSSQKVRVESLFIDEGFGSLDADTLRVAMDALDKLQASGRKVGVISHVQEMTERIPTRIRLHRQPGGHSRLEVEG